MKAIKKPILFSIFLILIFTIIGCSANSSKNEKETSAPALSNKMPVIVASDIISKVNTEVDYLSNIEISNVTSDEFYDININSSSVDISAAGEYSAIYMVEYAKGMITRQITVTIVEELSEEETLPVVVIEEVKNENQPKTTSTSKTIAETTQAVTAKAPTSPIASTSSGQTTSTQNTNQKSDFPNANIELSDGSTVEIKNTDSRYVVRTFSTESYYGKNGGKYLISELKVEFNTGEIQLLEITESRIE